MPWIDNRKARLVKSSSSPLPHLVTHQTKNQLYCCDSNCMMFKTFHLCSHVIAVAEINGELELFLCSLRKLTPNLTTIATEGLPSGSGRKGGQDKRRKRVKEKVVSRSVRPCLEQPHDLANAPTCSSNTCYEAASAYYQWLTSFNQWYVCFFGQLSWTGYCCKLCKSYNCIHY